MTEKKVSPDYDLSIIVCCYNGENTIEECLISLKNQKVNNNHKIEVLLIDDGSKDKTSQKILNFLETDSSSSNVHFRYFRKKNEGLSIARNYGISKSQSNIVAFIDEDAFADENFSENIIKSFSEHKDINCIGGSVKLLNSENSFAQLIQHGIFSLYMKSEKSIIGTNMAYRKSFLYEAGGFQPEFTYRGDESALFAKAKKSLKLSKVNNVIVKHPQPPNLKRWLRTRYENGYFTAAVYSLTNFKGILLYKRIILSLLTLTTPVVIIFFVLFFRLTSLQFIMVFYLLYIAKRFVFNNSIVKIINEYYTNTHEKRNLRMTLYIRWVVFLGYIFSDFGYLKGIVKYRNYDWFKGNALH